MNTKVWPVCSHMIKCKNKRVVDIMKAIDGKSSFNKKQMDEKCEAKF